MTDATKPLAGWRVLVVDDEFDSRAVATILLEDAGAEVIEAENGQEAWQQIQQTRPHFILSDLSMPEMDGWRLVTDISKDRGLSEIPVIALTAHAMVGDRERVIAAGFRNHITKPLDPDKFISQLLAILDEMPAIKAPAKTEEPPQSQPPEAAQISTPAAKPAEPASDNTPTANPASSITAAPQATEANENGSAAKPAEPPQNLNSQALTRTEHDEISSN